MVSAATTGTLAAIVVLGFTILGRLIYRIDRDLTATRERLARLEGDRRKGNDDDRD